MKKIFLGILLIFTFVLCIDNCYALEIGKVVSPTGVNIRSGPGTNYKSYGRLLYNDSVTIISKNIVASKNAGCPSGFYKVNINGYARYICSNTISFSNTTIKTKYSNANLYSNTNGTIFKRNVGNTMFSVISTKKYSSVICKNGMYKVNYNGSAKYICSSHVKYYNSKSNVIVTSSKANIYKNKGKNVLETVKYNQSFTLYESKSHNGYYKIYYRGHIRYIKTSDVLNTNYNYVVNNKSGANIRQKSMKNSKKIAKVKYGSYISLVSNKKHKGKGCNAGWYKIKINKKYAYICSNLVSNSSIITNTTSSVKVYKDLSAKKLKHTYQKNNKVFLLNDKKYKGNNCNDGYYKVYINQGYGYVCSTYTSIQNENATKIPVLTFHRIVSDTTKNTMYKNDEWTQSYDVFEKQIKYLYDNNYKTISLDEFYCWYKGNCSFPKKTVVLVFDDGNLDDYYLVMPLLNKYNFKGTTFIVGSRVKDKEDSSYTDTKRKYISQDIIDKTKENYPLHKFESHSYNFHYIDSNKKKRISNMTKDEIREDFDLNSGFNFKYIAYPYGTHTKDLREVVKEKNYLLGFGFSMKECATRTSNAYIIPRIKINGFSNLDTLKNYLLY